MKALVLRFDGPLVSFGGVMVDQHGVIDRFPGLSMLTGLLANALGWRHGDFERLQHLQGRIEYAARWDVPPQHLIHYQTVDLGRPKMQEPGWTTRGEPEHRHGGEAKTGTHQRYRHYWADGLMTVALAVKGEDEPNHDQVKEALSRPARPLFIGRRCCLPSRPLLDPRTPEVEAANLLEALQRAPAWTREGAHSGEKKFEACWPVEYGPDRAVDIRRVYDLRDWANQLPAGSRERAQGLVSSREVEQ